MNDPSCPGSCALFLRPHGGDYLNNQSFNLLKPREREQKLRAVLKACGDGTLDADEINRIVNSSSSGRQYTIALYDDPAEFVQAIRPTESPRFHPVCEDQPTAAIRSQSRDKDSRDCVIHIYIPAKGELSDE